MKIEDIGTVYRLTRLGFGPSEIRTLIRISVTLNRLSVRACNGEGWGPREYANRQWFQTWTEADADRVTKRVESLVRKAQTLCDESEYGRGLDHSRRLTAYHQGNPRGCSLYIVKRSELNGRTIGSCYSSIGVAV